MPQLVEVLGQRISVEAVLMVALTAVIFGIIIRELLILIFWRSVLIWVGFFVFVLAFTIVTVWLPSNFATKIKARRKPVKNLLRVQAFVSTKAKWALEVAALEERTLATVPIHPESILISEAIENLISNILRDFILSWFREISCHTFFPLNVDYAIRQAWINLSTKMKKVELAEVLVTKMMPIITDHFRNFVKAERFVRERSLERDLTDNKEFQYAVASQYCHGKLHPAISLKRYQYADYRKRWLIKHVDKLVPSLLGNSSTSKVVTHLCRDILACSLLFPVVSMLSESDFWNQILVNIAGPTMQDRRKVEKLIQALSEHATGNTAVSHERDGTKGKHNSLKLSPSADQTEHEKFLQEIYRCKSLPEARQTRYYISVQLQRSKKQGTNPHYISRLQQLKRAVDRQITKISDNQSIGGKKEVISPSSSRNESTVSLPDPREEYTLQQILSDPACTLFFMEYMDHRRRILLVQFWLTVNSLRNPLEEEIDEYDELNDNKENSGIDEPNFSKTITHMVHENDLVQIYKTYFHGHMPYVTLDAEETVGRFVKSPIRSFGLYRRARRAILQTQSVVYRAMEVRDLVRFKRSDLFLKFLASDRKLSSVGTGPSKRAATRNDVDSLQLDSIEDVETGKDKKSVDTIQAIEAAFNKIMENTNGPVRNNSTTVESRHFSSSIEKRGHKRSQKLFESSENELSEIENNQEEFGESKNDPDLHLAAPGDLSLTETIRMLSSEIDFLYQQQAVLEPLIRKAELTDNVGNLRILRKSKINLEREIQLKELQRQQYIVQESDNSLYGRSNIQIRSCISSSDSGGHYMLYLIEVERLSTDGSVAAGWVVSRRYNQFFQLHQHLQLMFPRVRKLAFPKKRVVMKFQHKSFIDSRKIALQVYLREILTMPEVCRSQGFRSFLSSETFSIDAQSNDSHRDSFSLECHNDNKGIQNEDELRQSITTDTDAEAELDETRPFIQPICDLFIQVFGFNRGNNWLRGRAVIVVVQQILGGTIEKKIRETVSSVTSEENLTSLVQKVTDAIWPDGIMKSPAVPRTNSEKIKCKHDARVIVHALVRDASIKIVGSSSARYASTQIFEMFQNEILNAHLVYTLMDVLLDELFDL